MDGRTINLKEVEDIVRFECGEWEGLAKTIIKRLEAPPPVDAVPVRHGKWVDDSNGIEGAWNYCSVCGEQAIDLYDFCPYCGADMRKDGDGNG